MTLFQWVCNRETEYFTVSDDDGAVVYDARETDADVPFEYDDMIVSDVLFPDSDCPDVIITTAENMADIIRNAKDNLSHYMELARRYGMDEYGQAVADALENMRKYTRTMAG